ncbi:MAG: hypothetical protein N3A38_11800 [Planctomycetota bacterium]|nr:hypothetical protein [Planctomycetota bacterium]
MKIRVMSGERLRRYEEQTPHVVVVITSPGFRPVLPQRPACRGVLHLEFDDIRSPRHEGKPLAATDAGRVWEFLISHAARIRTVIVSCPGGISRSAGVAAALAEYFGHDSNTYHRRPFNPNSLVINRMKAAMPRPPRDVRQPPPSERPGRRSPSISPTGG